MNVDISRDERARLDFADALMSFNSTGIGSGMAEYFETRRPAGKDSLQMDEVRQLMEPSSIYKFGAFFERHNHALMFENSLAVLKRQADAVHAWLDSCNSPGSLGRLELNPDLPVPKYYEKVEIHTQPGSYHGEFAGFLYHWMIDPFLVHRDRENQMGMALAKGVPRQDYRAILDLGCGIGKSTLPYCDLYPSAEVHGLDYAAPMLKYGHQLAESRGKKVTYHQQHAESTSFDDESFDLVTAIWLFHEIPRASMDKVVREALRLLRPGGVFAIMESPPFKQLNESYSPLTEFLIDSTGRRMSDPYIPMFFSLDRAELLKNNGFTEVWEEPLENHVTGYNTEGSYFFGAFPWWMTAGRKV